MAPFRCTWCESSGIRSSDRASFWRRSGYPRPHDVVPRVIYRWYGPMARNPEECPCTHYGTVKAQ